MKRALSITAILVLLILSGCNRQPTFERIVTAHAAWAPWKDKDKESRPGTSMGPVSLASQLELRSVFHSDEFWEFHTAKNQATDPAKISKTRRGYFSPTNQITYEGSDIIEEYRFQLQHGDQATFDSLIESYKIFQADQVERALSDVLSRKEISLLRLDAAQKSLSALDENFDGTNQKKSIESRERLERGLVHSHEHIGWLNEILRELAKVGKIISIESPPSTESQ